MPRNVQFQTGGGLIVMAAVITLIVVGWRAGIAVSHLSSDDCVITTMIEEGVEVHRTWTCK